VGSLGCRLSTAGVPVGGTGAGRVETSPETMRGGLYPEGLLYRRKTFACGAATLPTKYCRSRRRHVGSLAIVGKVDPGKDRPANALVPTRPGKAFGGSFDAPPTFHSDLVEMRNPIRVRFRAPCGGITEIAGIVGRTPLKQASTAPENHRAENDAMGRHMPAVRESDLGRTRRLLGVWMNGQQDAALKSHGRIILQNLRRCGRASDEATRRLLAQNVASFASAILAARRRTRDGGRELLRDIDREFARSKRYAGDEVRSIAFEAVMQGASVASAVEQACRQMTNERLTNRYREASVETADFELSGRNDDDY
jgi:hypothetical protein